MLQEELYPIKIGLLDTVTFKLLTNIEDYLLHERGFLERDFCKHALEVLEQSEWEKHFFTGYETNDPEHGFGWQREVQSSPSGGEEPEFLGHSNSGWKEEQAKINNVIIRKLQSTLTEYVRSFKYGWFDGWNGYSIIKFIKYSEGNQMAEHCDHISSLFDGKTKGIPMLSVVGQLNEDFEGGEFVMWGDKVIEFKGGDLIVFPSNFMYPHKVQPVKKGTRYSYVSWAY